VIGMDIRNIKKLVEILEQSGLTLVEVEENVTRVRLEKQRNCAVPAVNAAPAGNAAPAAARETPPPVTPGLPPPDGAVDFNSVVEVRSPMVGVYYAAPGPEEPPYVTVGTRVKKGDVLCIVEAMKLMNEITATHDGEIVDVCIQSGSVVEYGQTLFKLC